MKTIKESIKVKSINGDYFATFHTSQNSLLSAISSKSDSFYLVDDSLFAIYPEIFSNIPIAYIYSLQANEINKSLQKVSEIAEWLIKSGATKSSHLYAIGGGVIQDLATFTSHIYYRGINWTFIPTTLLSQADSCIGAKCALNLNGHKNQLGVVHTPQAVEIFTGFLKSLPYSEIQSGFGEIAKLSITGPGEFFNEFTEKLRRDGISSQNLDSIIQLSLFSKKYIVDSDEYETDIRRVLNYGHSFGHALESLTQSQLVHGDAVVIGMELINFLGVKWGITDPHFALTFQNLLNKYFLHVKVSQKVDASSWVEELKHDKKMKDGKMNFAIPRGIGDIGIYTRDLDADLVLQVGEYIDGSPRFNTA